MYINLSLGSYEDSGDFRLDTDGADSRRDLLRAHHLGREELRLILPGERDGVHLHPVLIKQLAERLG